MKGQEKGRRGTIVKWGTIGQNLNNIKASQLTNEDFGQLKMGKKNLSQKPKMNQKLEIQDDSK